MNPALFVHIPVQLLPARLVFLLNRKLQPEVACQEINLDLLDFAQLRECAAALSAAHLGTTLHAPFAGFYPGSSRRRIYKYSRDLALKSLLLAEAIGAKRVIFHPGLPYGSSAKQIDRWLQQNITFWPEFIALAEAQECCICIENIYETEPDALLQLCREMASPWFGHCFDIGHWNIFGTVKLQYWLDQMAPWLKHLHLHDNDGEQDQHLPIGRGYVSFSTLFHWLTENGCSPSFTLEAHNLPDLDTSLAALSRYLPKGI